MYAPCTLRRHTVCILYMGLLQPSYCRCSSPSSMRYWGSLYRYSQMDCIASPDVYGSKIHRKDPDNFHLFHLGVAKGCYDFITLRWAFLPSRNRPVAMLSVFFAWLHGRPTQELNASLRSHRLHIHILYAKSCKYV